MLSWLTSVGLLSCGQEAAKPTDSIYRSSDQQTTPTEVVEKADSTFQSTTDSFPNEPAYPCGPSLPWHFYKDRARFVYWADDSSKLVFDHDEKIWAIDSRGMVLDQVVDMNPQDHESPSAFHADISPDGSMIAYSTCQYMGQKFYYGEDFLRPRYEIAVVSIDGSVRKRLTQSDVFDGYPVWSPDGGSIAFVSSWWDTYRVDGAVVSIADSRSGITRAEISVPPLHAHLSRPAWSPDGRHVAFVAVPRGYSITDRAYHTEVPHSLHLASTDQSGEEPVKVTEIASPVSWSPDGHRIAFANREGDSLLLSTIAPDATDLRRIHTITSWANFEGRRGQYESRIDTVSWSPSGDHIAFSCDEGICIVDLEGNVVGQSSFGTVAAWSPDGTKLALRRVGWIPNGEGLIATMAPDGSDERVLLRLSHGHVFAENSDENSGRRLDDGR